MFKVKRIATIDKEKSYISINFVSKPYYFQLIDKLNVSVDSYYDFISTSIMLKIEDYLPWSFCAANVPLLYFVHDISIISNGTHWFEHRVGKGDIIVDKNGNLFSID